MADQYGLFWNSVSGDRTYDADSFSEWLGKFFTTGVFNGDLQVTPASGMVVNVGSGYANINGKVRFFDTDTSITISPASGVYPRIDTIVVRADYTNREIALAYVTGSYSGNNPQPTAPTRNASMYEIVLAQILVSAGSTEVTTASITDTRPDSTVCGWVTGTVDHVAVDQITEQAQAQFEAWFEHMKGQLSEDAAGNLQLQIDALDTRIDGIDAEIGDTDISTIGDGTVTGAVSALNNGLTSLENNPVIVWKSTTRSNISHAAGSNYWTMNDSFPTKSGYTRKIFGISISDGTGSVIATGWYLSGDYPVIRTRNVGSATVTIGISATYVYLKDSAQF